MPNPDTEILLTATVAERRRLVGPLDHSTQRNLAFFGVDVSGRRLEATDTDWHLGEGTPLRLSAKDVLLTITARKPLLADATS